jgi:AcrR family transcriptional regulator
VNLVAKDTRERILESALSLFAEKGYARTTTAEIARAVGVAEGTLYRHFADKKDIFVSCIMPAIEETVTSLENELLGAKDTREAVRNLLSARFHVFRKHMKTFKIVFAEAFYEPEMLDVYLNQIIKTRWERIEGPIERVIDRRGRDPVFTKLILTLGLTGAIWNMICFSGVLEKATDLLTGHRVTDEELLDAMTEFVLYGISGKPGSDA